MERAAEEGASVVVSSRKAANVERVVAELRARGLKAEGIPCHMGKTEDIKTLISETVRRLGRIDGLVSNAAVSPAMGPITGLSEAEWDKIFGINLRAAWLVAREAVPYMGSGASIIFVASTASFSPSFPLGAYGVSKTALLGLTKAMAQELGPSNIRVNCLAPGLIKTRFSEELWKSEEISSRTVGTTYLGRIGVASEMGGALCAVDGAQTFRLSNHTWSGVGRGYVRAWGGAWGGGWDGIWSGVGRDMVGRGTGYGRAWDGVWSGMGRGELHGGVGSVGSEFEQAWPPSCSRTTRRTSPARPSWRPEGAGAVCEHHQATRNAMARPCLNE